MNPDVQKVLDFIREGAKAASGPARWGFEQVCAYNATQAKAYLVSMIAFLVVSLIALVVFIYFKRNPPMVKKTVSCDWFNAAYCNGASRSAWGEGESKNSVKRFEWSEDGDNEWATGGIIGATISVIMALLLMVGFTPQLYSTIRNPAGYTINNIIGLR